MTQSPPATSSNLPYFWTRQGISLQEIQEKFAELLESSSGGGGNVDLTEVNEAVAAAQAAAGLAKSTADTAQAQAATAVTTATAAQNALTGKAATSHTHNLGDLNTSGTPSNANFLRGDGAWATPAGGGGSSYLALSTKTADFTIADDGIDCYEVNAAGAVTVTLPAAVPAGTNKEILQAGAGQVTLAAGAGAVLRAPASGGAKTSQQWASVFARSRQSTVVSAPPSTNMILRFKGDDLAGANGSAVSSWAESSGQGHPAATQPTGGNQPTVATNSGGTGHKGVVFNGSSSFLSLSGTALNVARNRSALVVFAAIAFTSAVSTGTRTLFSLSTGTGGTSSRVLLGHRDSVSGFPILGGRRLDANSLASITAGPAINTVQNTVLTGRVVYSSSDLYLYKDGTQVATTTSFQTDGTSQDTASLTGVIGANLAGNNEWFQGHLLELLVYDGDDASGTLRQNVHSYLSQLYGISLSDALAASTEWVVSGGVA